jgi:hypothetical protein
MARKTGTVAENQFIQGLFTEATGLNFPPKASPDCLNVRFERTGAIKKRNGIIQSGSVDAGVHDPSGVCKSYLWKAVGSDGARTFLVIQEGALLTFWEADNVGDYSGGRLPFDINLNDFRAGGNPNVVANAEAGIVSGNGRLYVTHPYCDPFYISYNDKTNSLTPTSFKLEIRDFEGVEDETAIGERPKTLTDLHKYNLYNQGWDQGKVPQGRDHKRTPIAAWHEILGVYPSNADVWWMGKGVNKDGQEAITEKTVQLVSKSTGFAPKGHYIFNAFDMNRVARSGIKGIPGKTSEGYRPSVCAFYAGRVFFGGVPHPDYQGKVYYSQIIEGEQNIGRCYQANDPTSEQQSDLLDTDGGEIKVTGMGKVSFMAEVGNSLFVFANNGIWAIGGSGAEGTGFVATDFSIKKISSTGTEASMSFVDVEGSPTWWNYDGIWTLGQDGVTSLTNQTIKTFFQTQIPGGNRRYVQGAYNPLTQKIQWIYQLNDPTASEGYVPSTAANRYTYDSILEFDTVSKAFYPLRFTGFFNTIFCATDITTYDILEEDVYTTTGELVTKVDLSQITTETFTGQGYSSSRFYYYTPSAGD